MARMGMQTDEVRQRGVDLKARSADLASLISQLDRIVGALPGIWTGADASMFASSKWPPLRTALVNVQGSIDGLGQSLLNNVEEQIAASKTSGGAGSAGITAGGGVTPGVTGGGGTPPVSTSTPDSPGLDYTPRAQVGLDFLRDAATNKVAFDVDGAYGNQCVDLINAYSNKIYPEVSHSVTLGSGNANVIYGNDHGGYFERIAKSEIPKPGDIVCIGPNQYSGVGHVAVVDRVENGVIHVLEQDGNNRSGHTLNGKLGPASMAALQGYLRPSKL